MKSYRKDFIVPFWFIGWFFEALEYIILIYGGEISKNNSCPWWCSGDED